MEKRAYIDPDWTPDLDKPVEKKASVKSLDNDFTKQAAKQVTEKLKEQKDKKDK